MYCAISGEVPLEPVVSAKSGHVFEKRLILKALEASQGVCPATGGELSPTDLIDVKADASSAVRPRPLTATSVPGMLAMFQNEWDEVMLETHRMKQQLHSTRKELSHALYQHDAACRVVARLSRERDEAKAMLADLQHRVAELEARPPSAVSAPAAEAVSMEVEKATENGGDEEEMERVAEKLTSFWQKASKARKKRSIPSTLASHDEIRRWTKQKALQFEGASCLARVDEQRIAAGGFGGNVAVVENDAILRAKLFSSDVLSIAPLRGDLFVACDAESAALCRAERESQPQKMCDLFTISIPLAGIATHPAGDLCLAGRKDGSMELVALHDQPKILYSIKQTSTQSSATGALTIHPDGLIAAQAISSPGDHLIRVWDLKERSNVHEFQGHSAPVTSVDFSQNGYYMATTSLDKSLRVWDLRKLKLLHQIDHDTPLSSVTFDHSGKYLAAAAAESVFVTVVKEWNNRLVDLPVSTNQTSTNSIVFSDDAKALVAAHSAGATVDFFS